MRKLITLSSTAIRSAQLTIPEHMQESLIEFFEIGRPPGSFLRAVLANNLLDAVVYADHINKDYLSAYARWLYDYPPGRGAGSPWGSYENVEAWVLKGVELRNQEKEVTA